MKAQSIIYEVTVTGRRFIVKQKQGYYWVKDRLDNSLDGFYETREEAEKEAAIYNAHCDSRNRLVCRKND